MAAILGIAVPTSVWLIAEKNIAAIKAIIMMTFVLCVNDSKVSALLYLYCVIRSLTLPIHAIWVATEAIVLVYVVDARHVFIT